MNVSKPRCGEVVKQPAEAALSVSILFLLVLVHLPSISFRAIANILKVFQSIEVKIKSKMVKKIRKSPNVLLCW